MLIILGTRLSKKKLGFAANYCVFCRDIRKVRLDRLQMQKHFYYINYRPDSDPWTIQKCTECKGEAEVDATNFPKILKKAKLQIEELILKTNPNIFSEFKERLKLETKVKRAPLKLSDKERNWLINEPFTALEPQIERAYNSGINIDWKILITMAIGTVGSIVMFTVANIDQLSESRDTFVTLAWITTILSIIAVIISMSFESRRRIKKKYLGLLVQTLRPLKPKPEELQQIADFYAITKAKVGKKWIYRELTKRLEIENINSTANSVENKTVLDPDVKKGDYVKAMKDIKK